MTTGCSCRRRRRSDSRARRWRLSPACATRSRTWCGASRRRCSCRTGHRGVAARSRWSCTRSIRRPLSRRRRPLRRTTPTIKYALMTSVAEHWIPFIPVHVEDDNREIQLQRAAMPRLLEGAEGVTPRRSRRARDCCARAWTTDPRSRTTSPRKRSNEPARSWRHAGSAAAGCRGVSSPGSSHQRTTGRGEVERARLRHAGAQVAANSLI